MAKHSTSSVTRVEHIGQSILLLRGQRVLPDRDLARVYGVQTRMLNQAVKRNGGTFPAGFRVRLDAR